MNTLKRLFVTASLSAALLAPAIVAPTSSWAPTPQARAALGHEWPRVRAGETDRAWVLCVQYLLRARGYRVGADGRFGSQTSLAVKRFQRANGLTADGSVGPQTWPLLCRTLRRGAKGDAVRALQVVLNSGTDGPKVKVDGVFGAQTEDLVREYQRAMIDFDEMHIEMNGVADAEVWASSLQAANTHA